MKVCFCFLGSEDDDDDDDDDRNDFHGVEDFTKKKVLVEKSKPPKTTDVKCFSYTWLLIINLPLYEFVELCLPTFQVLVVFHPFNLS